MRGSSVEPLPLDPDPDAKHGGPEIKNGEHAFHLLFGPFQPLAKV